MLKAITNVEIQNSAIISFVIRTSDFVLNDSGLPS